VIIITRKVLERRRRDSQPPPRIFPRWRFTFFGLFNHPLSHDI
jgi:hypothetical protein